VETDRDVEDFSENHLELAHDVAVVNRSTFAVNGVGQ
jgi:hypothetical protein